MAFYIAGGLMEFVVPFVLTFALSLGVIKVSGVFKGQEQVNFLIALGLSLLAVSSSEYVSLLNEWAPTMAILLIVVFIIVFLKNLFLSEKKGKTDMQTLIILALLFLVLMYLGPALPLPSGNTITSDDILLVGGLALVIAILSIGHRLGGADTPEQTQQRM